MTLVAGTEIRGLKEGGKLHVSWGTYRLLVLHPLALLLSALMGTPLSLSKGQSH